MKDLFCFNTFLQHRQLIHGVSQKKKHLAHQGSLALHTGELQEAIVQNRQHLMGTLGLNTSWHFVVANQTHSSNVAIIKEATTQGWGELSSAVENCDAMLTNQKEVLLTVLTADCVPVLLFDRVEKVVGVVHAGWRGTEANIAGKTIQKMQEVYGSTPRNIVAGIAPSIGVCCYEVDSSVAGYFQDFPDALKTKENGKFMLDLPKINHAQLLKAGLLEENIELSGICTACSVEEYFSYRREQGCSGRFMSVIGLC